ncbi:flagellar biosynthetic protein FliO [Polaromonas sp.]|uniref:flagellar biosynthetic protein FliO n=1 Tax=Polaromonas sp. TaxID=1869339 RepID=UPI003267ED13
MIRLQLPRLAAALLASISLAAGAALPTVPTAASEPVRSFGMGGFLQAAFGLATVLALIFLCGWAARRLGLRQSGSGRLLKVVSSAMVGQRERVVVVEIGGSWLVLGVAAGQVRALHTMPAEQQPEVQAASGLDSMTPAAAFSRKLLESLGKFNHLKKQD